MKRLGKGDVRCHFFSDHANGSGYFTYHVIFENVELFVRHSSGLSFLSFTLAAGSAAVGAADGGILFLT